MDLSTIFNQLCSKYTADKKRSEKEWTIIQKNYTQPGRCYHNLRHLAQLIEELEPCRALSVNWSALLFAVFYHDIIYSIRKKDNEERSADAAQKALAFLKVPNATSVLCIENILATKSHAVTGNPDTNLFTDADLSIHGKSPEVYDLYCAQIRKEYSVYPNLLYRPGRKKVVLHLLEMPCIFKTAFFYERYESSARNNLHRELNSLN